MARPRANGVEVVECVPVGDWPLNLALVEQFGNAIGMDQRCEVCQSFRPRGDLEPARKLVEVTFGERRVLLCSGHAGIAQNSQVSSFDELRALYAESEGKRSYIPRRTRGTSSGSPRGDGRRSGDLAR